MTYRHFMLAACLGVSLTLALGAIAQQSSGTSTKNKQSHSRYIQPRGRRTDAGMQTNGTVSFSQPRHPGNTNGDVSFNNQRDTPAAGGQSNGRRKGSGSSSAGTTRSDNLRARNSQTATGTNAASGVAVGQGNATTRPIRAARRGQTGVSTASYNSSTRHYSRGTRSHGTARRHHTTSHAHRTTTASKRHRNDK